MTYVVRRFKPKLLVFITTGTFNLLSKILTTLRLSGAVWIEAWKLVPSCPRTCAPISFRLSDSSSFAPFPVYRVFVFLSTLKFWFFFSSRSSSLIAVATRRTQPEVADKYRSALGGYCAKFERSTSKCSSQFWLANSTKNRGARVLQWDCSLRDSLQGIRGTCLTCPNEPASCLTRLATLHVFPDLLGPPQKLHCS
jgi:hypothetical protein